MGESGSDEDKDRNASGNDGENGSGNGDEGWDNWRLRLTDYGIGILIALVLTPTLIFVVLLAVSGTFRDFVLR